MNDDLPRAPGDETASTLVVGPERKDGARPRVDPGEVPPPEARWGEVAGLSFVAALTCALALMLVIREVL
jgi:hypothetical protein